MTSVETDMLRIAMKNEDPATRAKLIAHFSQSRANSEFFALYPSSETFDEAMQRAAAFKCNSGPVIIWGTRGYQGQTIVSGAMYCRALVDPDEFASLLQVIRIGAEGNVVSAWLGEVVGPEQTKDSGATGHRTGARPSIEVERLAATALDLADTKEARQAAMRELTALGEVVTAFAIGSKHENVEIRRAMTMNLGYTEDARAIQPAIEALTDSDAGVRWSAAMSLGKLGGAAAVDALHRAAAEDPDERVRHEAAMALDQLGRAR